MGKGKLLDIANKTEVRSQIIKRQKSEVRSQAIIRNNYISFKVCSLFSVFCLLIISGCSLPRIIILDDPLTPHERINLGVVYERMGEIDKAIEEYERASKKLPVAHLYLGNAYFQKGDFHEAERHYRIAIRKVPDLSDAYNNLAWLYYNKAKDPDLTAEYIKEILKEAEGLVIKALKLKPSDKNYKNTLNKIRELKNGKH